MVPEKTTTARALEARQPSVTDSSNPAAAPTCVIRRYARLRELPRPSVQACRTGPYASGS
jgi:hypothetical protein